MKKITVLAMDDAAATTITGAFDVFGLTGVLYNQACGQHVVPHFDVEIVTPGGKAVNCLNKMQILPHRAMEAVEQTDLVIVSAILDINKTLSAQGEVVPWLVEQYLRGAHLASICSGSFVLAETGLLDGKEATTHWGMAKSFISRYPKVNLKPERLITDAGDIYCSGAFNSCIDLSIYLVEKFYGHEIAVESAKALVHDIGRVDQTPYTPFLFQCTHKDSEIAEVQRVIESNYNKDVNITVLARRHGIGRRTLERRFKLATGDTPLLYQQRVRVERARKILESQTMTFDEICYEVGYENSSFFRKIFMKHTGLRPTEYRAKFCKSYDLSKEFSELENQKKPQALSGNHNKSILSQVSGS